MGQHRLELIPCRQHRWQSELFCLHVLYELLPNQQCGSNLSLNPRARHYHQAYIAHDILFKHIYQH